MALAFHTLESPSGGRVLLIDGPLRFAGWCGCREGRLPSAVVAKIGSRVLRCRRSPEVRSSSGGLGFRFYREFTTSGGFKLIKLVAIFDGEEVTLWTGLVYNRYPSRNTLLANTPKPAESRQSNPAVHFQNRPLSVRIAAIVHLYYEDLWPEMASSLRNIPESFDTYVTVRRDVAPATLDAIRADFPKAVILPVDNRGRDILPFLHVMEQMNRDRYVYVCKVHAKRAPHRCDGETWRKELLSDLLGSPSIVRQMLNAFDDNPRLGLVAPWDNLPNYSALPGDNHVMVADLAKRMRAESFTDFPFPKGSMFWARMAALEPLVSAKIKSEEFAQEAGQMDGTIAYAIERVFGLSALKAGYTCEEAPEILLTDKSI